MLKLFFLILKYFDSGNGKKTPKTNFTRVKLYKA